MNESTFSRRLSAQSLILLRRAASASSTALFTQIVQSTQVVPPQALHPATSEQKERPWRSSASSAFGWLLQSRFPWFEQVGHWTTGSFEASSCAAAVPVRERPASTSRQRERRVRREPVGGGFMWRGSRRSGRQSKHVGPDGSKMGSMRSSPLRAVFLDAGNTILGIDYEFLAGLIGEAGH